MQQAGTLSPSGLQVVKFFVGKLLYCHIQLLFINGYYGF